MCNASIVSISKLLKWRRHPRRRLARQELEVLTKAKRKNLVTSIKEVIIDLLLEEVTGRLQQTFKDSTTLKEYVRLQELLPISTCYLRLANHHSTMIP